MLPLSVGNSTRRPELSRETSVSNHITPDGLLDMRGKMHGGTCERPIRYRSETLILQDNCGPEPSANLTIRRPDSFDGMVETLDVAAITELRDALTAYLQDHKPPRIGWMYNGVTYDMDAAWWGRKNTRYFGLMFRHTGQWRDGIPLMKVTPERDDYAEPVPMTTVLGIAAAADEYAAEERDRAVLLGPDMLWRAAAEDDDAPGVAYGEGFEPRGDRW
jgi:hypothetical protein